MVFNTTTTNDQGEFELTLTSVSPGPADIVTNGFYFNEISGKLSTAPISMRALAEVTSSGTQTSYVNALTHMAQKRAQSLYVGGQAFTGAVTQAEQELRAALGVLAPSTVGAATDMNLLGGDTDDNAYLMAVSCILGQVAKLEAPDAVDAKLQEFINLVASELEANGTLDPSIVTRMDAGVASLDGFGCMANMQARLDELGVVQDVPNIYKSLDFDDDMTADVVDTDADGDGVMKASDTLVSIAAGHMVIAAVDNIDGANGGHVWLLYEFDNSVSPPVGRYGVRQLETSPGVPMTGAVQVFGDGASGITIHKDDGSLWHYGNGNLTQFTAVPANITSLYPMVMESAFLAVTSSNEVYYVNQSASTLQTHIPSAVLAARAGMGVDMDTYVDTTDKVWIGASGATSVEVTGLPALSFTDVATFNDFGYVLASDGTVWSFQITLTTPSATQVTGVTGGTDLQSSESGVYVLTSTNVWSLSPPSTATEIMDSSDLIALGDPTYNFNCMQTCLLGIKSDAPAGWTAAAGGWAYLHPLDSAATPRYIYVPQ